MKNIILILFVPVMFFSCKKSPETLQESKISTSELRGQQSIDIRVNGINYNTLIFGEYHNEIVTNCQATIADTSDLMSATLSNITGYINTLGQDKYLLFMQNTSFDSSIIRILGKRTHNYLNNGINELKLMQDTLFMMGFLSQQELNLLHNFIDDIFNLGLSPSATKSKYITAYNNLYSSSNYSDSDLNQIYVGTIIGLMIHSKELWMNWDYGAKPLYYRNLSGEIVVDTITPASLCPILSDFAGGLIGTYGWIYRNSDRIESSEDVGDELMDAMIDNTLNSSTLTAWSLVESFWGGD